MPALEHRAQIPPRKLRHESVLAFLGDDAASATPIRFDKPAVIRRQHPTRVPSKFMRRLEGNHTAGDSRAKGSPLDFGFRREVGWIPTKKINVSAVAIPFRPLRRSNKPSPNALRQRSNRDFIARVNR